MTKMTKPSTKPVPKDLSTLFDMASTEGKYRLLVGSQGLERTGKSQFWMTAPDPIGVVNFDTGIEGVVEKWSKKKSIWCCHVHIPAEGNAVKEHITAFNRAKDAYFKVVNHKDVRTVVIDTACDLWELMRLAEFGKLNPAADIKRAYHPLNQLYKSFILEAFNTDKNLIMTHKVKQRYVSKKTANGETDVWDGTYERCGFKHTGYLIQVNVEHRFTKENGFSLYIVDCRQNMDIAGLELFGGDATFPGLAACVFPDTSLDDWK